MGNEPMRMCKCTTFKSCENLQYVYVYRISKFVEGLRQHEEEERSDVRYQLHNEL